MQKSRQTARAMHRSYAKCAAARSTRISRFKSICDLISFQPAVFACAPWATAALPMLVFPKHLIITRLLMILLRSPTRPPDLMKSCPRAMNQSATCTVKSAVSHSKHSISFERIFVRISTWAMTTRRHSISARSLGVTRRILDAAMQWHTTMLSTIRSNRADSSVHTATVRVRLDTRKCCSGISRVFMNGIRRNRHQNVCSSKSSERMRGCGRRWWVKTQDLETKHVPAPATPCGWIRRRSYSIARFDADCTQCTSGRCKCLGRHITLFASQSETRHPAPIPYADRRNLRALLRRYARIGLLHRPRSSLCARLAHVEVGISMWST